MSPELALLIYFLIGLAYTSLSRSPRVIALRQAGPVGGLVAVVCWPALALLELGD